MFPYATDLNAPRRRGEIIFLCVANFIAFLLSVAGFVDLDRFGFVPADHVWYSWITYQFLHGGVDHILGNLWALWIFGDVVAARLGRRFLPFYLAGGAFANLFMLLAAPSSRIPCIGASGAICAVIGAYVVWFPRARMRCFWFSWETGATFFRISALVFAVSFVLLQLIGVLSAGDGIAYPAHLGGLAFGALVAVAFRGSEPDFEENAPEGDWAPIVKALDAGSEEYAMRLYVEKLRADRELTLPPGPGLKFVRKLAELGQGQLALAVARRQLERFPADPNAAGLIALEKAVLTELFGVGAGGPPETAPKFVLPPARAVRQMSFDLSGLTIVGEAVSWGHCLRISALGLPLGALVRREAGLLEVDGVEHWDVGDFAGERAEYEDRCEIIPCIEIVTTAPARWRWPASETAPSEEAAADFYRALQDLLLAAPAAVGDPSMCAAFFNKLPPELNFTSMEDAEAHIEREAARAWARRLSRREKPQF
jgi:membrane associated rhomboid family serine protease